jgi:hypothetical protein
MKLTAPIAFASVGFLSVPALAQENGIAKMAPAVPITVGGPWNEFSFTSAGSLAKGAGRSRRARMYPKQQREFLFRGCTALDFRGPR